MRRTIKFVSLGRFDNGSGLTDRKASGLRVGCPESLERSLYGFDCSDLYRIVFLSSGRPEGYM
jgi:hypothetical protein